MNVSQIFLITSCHQLHWLFLGSPLSVLSASVHYIYILRAVNKDKFITRNVSVNQKLNLIKALAQVVS